ncbi:MAG: hypothetical protein RI601_10225 [Desulfurivibrionaceae bacterium]|nr:hypothetical protein [Desulfurivibrionaceae bacterium]
MAKHILRSVAATLLIITLLFLSSTPFATVALAHAGEVDSCCHPTGHNDQPVQPCDPARDCSCLFCLHIDLPRPACFFHQPLSFGTTIFPVNFPAPTDFTPSIDYPPESC